MGDSGSLISFISTTIFPSFFKKKKKRKEEKTKTFILKLFTRSVHWHSLLTSYCSSYYTAN